MNSNLDLIIRGELIRYLVGEISLRDFQNWFVSATWNLEETHNSLAQELASEIQLKLAEYTNGHWSEEELRRILRPLVQSYTVAITLGTQALPSTFSTTNSESLRHQFVGTVFSAAFS